MTVAKPQSSGRRQSQGYSAGPSDAKPRASAPLTRFKVNAAVGLSAKASPYISRSMASISVACSRQSAINYLTKKCRTSSSSTFDMLIIAEMTGTYVCAVFPPTVDEPQWHRCGLGRTGQRRSAPGSHGPAVDCGAIKRAVGVGFRNHK